MSAISSATSAAPDLFQVLQTLGQPASTTTGAAGASTNPSTTGQTENADGGHHHHHHGGGGGLSKIESAVTAALQSSDGTEDPNQVVKDAIAKALGSNDPAAGGSATTAAGAADPSASTTDPAASKSAFDQLLQSYGIDPQQFGQDLHSALAGVKGGSGGSNGNSVDFATLFKSFPPGSAIETTG